MNIGSSGWLTFTNISNINSNTYYGISVSGYQITFGEIKNTNQNGSHGLAINSVYGLLIGILRSSSGNLGQSGIFMSSVTGFIGLANISNNAQYGVYFSSPSEVTIKSLTTTANNNAAIYANGGSLYLLGATLNETTVTSIAGGYNGRIYSQGEDGSANNNWIYVESGTINSQAVTRGGASGLEWKHTITSSTRLSEFPLFLSLAKIAVAAYFTKSHATNIEGRLVCKGGQIAGVDNDVVSSAMAANTNAQQITIQFTPTAAGVVEILSEAYYVAANGYVLVDTVGISQA
jgi:hypothetical protein